MTRDRFKDMQVAALESLKSKVEVHRKNPHLQPFLRDALENKYQALLQKQAEWERGGFWTDENEKRYMEIYKRLN